MTVIFTSLFLALAMILVALIVMQPHQPPSAVGMIPQPVVAAPPTGGDTIEPPGLAPPEEKTRLFEEFLKTLDQPGSPRR
jgi:hypothetical protein